MTFFGMDFWHTELRTNAKSKNRYDIKKDVWHLFPNVPVKNDRKFIWRYQESGDEHVVEVRSTVKPAVGILPPDGYYGLNFYKSTIDFFDGEELEFYLVASPQKQGSKNRVGIYDEETRTKWVHKVFSGIANIESVDIIGDEVVYGRSGNGRVNTKIPIVSFYGRLVVLDAEEFSKIYLVGVGHSKFLGCGMLSVR